MVRITYAVVQEGSVSKKKTQMCVLPSSWVFRNGWKMQLGIDDGKGKDEGEDKGFWPENQNGHDDLERALTGEMIYPKENSTKPFRCIIKRSNIDSRQQVIIRNADVNQICCIIN